MVDYEKEEALSLQSEFEWVLHKEVHAVLQQLNVILVECVQRFPMPFGSLEGSQQKMEKFALSTSHDQIKCAVSLLGDSISHADIHFKVQRQQMVNYRASIQSDNPWRLHQIQDAANHLHQALLHIDNIDKGYIFQSSEEVLHSLANILGCLQRGRSSLIVPRKRTIDDLMKSRNMKCLVPNLPEDLAVSFYIQSHKLVFAVYQVSSINGNMKFETQQAETSIPWLNELLVLFTVALQLCQQLKDKEAVPVNDSSEEFDARQFGPVCYQNHLGNYRFLSNMSEDCLYLDIYTPDVKASLPVLVFVYGGAFFEGSTQEYSGQYFMETQRVVTVIISYRLGAFGFLYLGDNYPANLGIRDQILALKWIQGNVKYFGGDASRVTVNGQSAGGASVDILMRSPLTKGLFIGAITESGTSCSRFGLQPACTGFERRDLLAFHVNCFTSLPFFTPSVEELVSCFRRKSASEILTATTNFPLWMETTFFPPIMESPSAYKPVITTYPWLEQSPGIDLVPWLTGVNSNEGYELINQFPIGKSKLFKLGLQLFVGIALPDSLFYKFTARFPFLVTAKLKAHYWKYYSSNINEFVNQVVNQGFFYYPLVRCLANVRSPTYVYYFNYSLFQFDNQGVPHSRELIYNWDLSIKIRSNGVKKDIEFSKKVVNAWIDFAYYQSTNFSGIVWERYNTTEDNVLIINNDEIKMGPNPNRMNNSFWSTLEIDTKPKTRMCLLHEFI